MNTSTIFMPRASWEKWDKWLRDESNKQGVARLCEITDSGPEFCCLGGLQMALTGLVETYHHGEINPKQAIGDHFGFKALPSDEWLEKHNIRFYDSSGWQQHQPWLPSLKLDAAVANDGDITMGARTYSFVEIADAIKACVQFTD